MRRALVVALGNLRRDLYGRGVCGCKQDEPFAGGHGRGDLLTFS